VENRPGLSSVRYRIGTHSTFFDAMLRRLTVPVDEAQGTDPYSLHRLRTRELDDPAIALLDSWALLADVLTFYQERIANEAFLRTATERRSILELGGLVGYRLKPGVSASGYLAYTLDPTTRTIIPVGTKAQSIPGANEQPQTFETSEATEARGAWNALLPRMSRPQEITLENVLKIPSLWIDGTATRLDVREPLLFVFEIPGAGGRLMYALRRTLRTNIDLEHKRTEVVLEPVRQYYQQLADVVTPLLKPKAKTSRARAKDPAPLEEFAGQLLLGVTRTRLMQLAKDLKLDQTVIDAAAKDDVEPTSPARDSRPQRVADFLAPLVKRRGAAPASQWQSGRLLATSLGDHSDYKQRLLAAFYPQLGDTLYGAIASNASGEKPYAQFRELHVLRRRAAVFGYNAPTVLFEDRPGRAPDEPGDVGNRRIVVAAPPVPKFVTESSTVLYLDTPDEAVTVGSYVVVQSPARPFVRKVLEAETLPRTAYGISGRSTRLALSARWWTPEKSADVSDALKAMIANLEVIRNTAVWAGSEQLTLAQQPVNRPIGKALVVDPLDRESEVRIELDSVVDGITPGRWVIVTGERVDTSGTSGVVAAELAMVDNIEQHTVAEAGGAPYSVLVLAPAGLAYRYKRATAKILGNVVKATNGETRVEILGAGDAARPLQTFALHQSPLTFVSAPTVDGVASTLAVRVNDVLWHEADSLADATPVDRVFVTSTDDDGKVSVIFGNGSQGARLPSGADNVRAVYRSGIGRGGNVRAGQIATAISRPLGVTDVVNPLRTSGGADPESRDDARRNIPVSLQAMGRVVSVRDYADFARTFAGIAKASAVALSDGRRRQVHLTIGGTGDIEIDESSDLHRNLVEAIRRYGDPYQPFVVAMREKIVIAGQARAKVHPDYLWTDVAPRIRAALAERFAYDRRDFAEPVYPAEVVATIQSVPGVSYVDLDALGGIKPTDLVQFPPATAPNQQAAPSASRGGAIPRAPKAVVPNDPPLPAISGVSAIVPRLARRAHHVLRPAQIAYLPPELLDLFVLTEITND
jgi:hypothetical protein